MLTGSGLAAMYFLSLGSGGSLREINWQDFRINYLERGEVDHVVISNKSVAKVYLKSDPANVCFIFIVIYYLFFVIWEALSLEYLSVWNANIFLKTHFTLISIFSSQCHIFFNIGSVDSFEKNLYQSQEELGIDSAFYIPVTYSKEVEWL